MGTLMAINFKWFAGSNKVSVNNQNSSRFSKIVMLRKHFYLTLDNLVMFFLTLLNICISAISYKFLWSGINDSIPAFLLMKVFLSYF